MRNFVAGIPPKHPDKHDLKTIPHWLAAALAEGLAPALARWAGVQECRIIAEGRCLPEDLQDFAAKLGIERPEELRWLEIDPIPLPLPMAWVKGCQWLGLPVFAPGGMALGRGIFLLPGQMTSLRHELVHVLQYQRLGGIRPFLKRYLIECLEAGYADASLEKEARQRS